MNEGILVQLQANGSFETAYGTMYSWDAAVGPPDGAQTPITAGLVNTKTQEPPYKLGDKVWWQENGHTKRGDKKLKISKNPPQQGGGNFSPRPAGGGDDRQKSIVTQFAIREALVYLQYTCQQPDKLTMRDVAAHARHFMAMVHDIDGYIEKHKVAPQDVETLPF